MKKRFISFVSAAMVAFVSFAQVSEKAVQFTAVQDEASLVAGKRYIVVAEAEEGLVALSDQYNGTTSYRLQSDVLTVEDGAVVTSYATAVAEENLAVPYMLLLEGAPGEWKLYDEANGKYLHWTSKRSMELDEEGSVWSITINEDGEAEIVLEGQDRVVEQVIDRTVCYGAEGQRFACYADPKIQTAVKLYEPIVSNSFIGTYAELELLTEAYPSIWMIPAVTEKFSAVQEAGYAIKDNLLAASDEEIDALSASINEAIAYVKAMDAKYNEFKDLLFLCYEYQDNSTASSEVTAAFAEVVDSNMGYQWSFPATTEAEADALIEELYHASFLYALRATANESFAFELPVESSWLGESLNPESKYYLYNTASTTYLSQGNAWGTRASLDATGFEIVVTADSAIQPAFNKSWYIGDNLFMDNGTKEIYEFEEVNYNDLKLYLIKKDGEYLCSTDASTELVTSAKFSEACLWQFVTLEQRDAVALAGLEGASLDAPADATFLVKGAEFNFGNTGNWSGSPKNDGRNSSFGNTNGEKWNAGVVEISQVLRNLPAGAYRLSVQGFYRMGGMAEAAAARTDGTEVLHAKFFANADSIPVMSVLDCAGMLEGVGNAGYTGYGLAPNSQLEAGKFFDAGLYEHSFYFTLAEGVDTIKLGVAKTGSVGYDWLVFDNFRLEYVGVVGEENFLGTGLITSMPEGDHYVYYTDAKGKNHFLNAAGTNNWVVSDIPTAVTFSAGNTKDDPYASAASFMASNGFYMSNAANSDGSGAIKTETITGGNGSKKRTWESQVFYKNGAGKHAIRLTNSKGTSWGANCFVNIDPATLVVVSGQPSLADALYLWEVASVDDPRFTTEALKGLLEQAEALTGACDKDVKAALDAAVAAAKAVEGSDIHAVKTALEAAIEDAKASIAEYAVLYQTIEKANSMLVEDITPYDDLAEAVELAENLYTDGTVEENTLADLEAALAAYIEAIEAYVVADAVVNGTFGDASAASVDGWTQVGGETGKTGNHNKWTNVNDGFFEQWKNTLPDVEIYQEISGLPAGTYTFAAYVVACQQNNDDSYEVSGVNLFANSDSVAIHTINIDRNDANKLAGAEFVMVTTTIAAGETLKVGMSVKSTDANWIVMDNAKLYNFGEGYNTANTTGIDEVELGEVAGREFFNAAGVAVDAPVQGITIVKTTYTNGVVKVSKVFVK